MNLPEDKFFSLSIIFLSRSRNLRSNEWIQQMEIYLTFMIYSGDHRGKLNVWSTMLVAKNATSASIKEH